jgi:hypothetical protein
VPKMLSALRGQQGDDDDVHNTTTTNANTTANEQQHSSKDKKHKDTSATTSTTTVPLAIGDEQRHTAINGSGGSGIRKRSLSWGNARSSSSSNKANTGLSSNSTTTAPTIQITDATAEQVRACVSTAWLSSVS